MKKNTKLVDPENYPNYGDSEAKNLNKKTCKKACEDNEPTQFRIVWDHEISEKIFELEAKILTYTIIGAATLFISICNLVALIIKK
jgi:hypothetical protein